MDLFLKPRPVDHISIYEMQKPWRRKLIMSGSRRNGVNSKWGKMIVKIRNYIYVTAWGMNYARGFPCLRFSGLEF